MARQQAQKQRASEQDIRKEPRPTQARKTVGETWCLAAQRWSHEEDEGTHLF